MNPEYLGEDRIVLVRHEKRLPYGVYLRGGGEQTPLAAFLNKGEAWIFARTVAERMVVEVEGFD